MQIYRSREVGQSYITSVGTTLLAIGHALWLMVKIRPQVILCNGPGTCIPICAIAFVFKILGIRWSYIFYVESIARVKRLSLSGLLLYKLYMETLLNKKSVKQALGVGDIEFVSCSTTVYTAMLVDWVRNLEAAPFEVDGSEAGLRKICGPLSFLKSRKKQKQITLLIFETEYYEFALRGDGCVAMSKQVHDAGHMVPMDQPKAALENAKEMDGCHTF
nr:UDP-N-acetylglucosamine transferase subunit ALG14 homolog [Tanacetum cinerariifolium]